MRICLVKFCVFSFLFFFDKVFKWFFFFFFQAEDGIRDHCVAGVQTCALPISPGTAQDAFSSTSPFRAGFGTIDDRGNNFNGLIDEVAVFDRALSADELSSIYNTAIKGRSEERRVGKECRYWCGTNQEKKKM